ncbi:Uncharacterised protein [Enterobacter hormaechei]|nr:Uncharacterised protein [Enterobacter hormaechei]SAB36546.1 Uncharacterised protein [Enterobacter hormaechei]SAC09970.1 Uncharacterised protein [Enterobacter hormaechei]SAF17217.1 Uncharacterised protein [Enterobacter hormaechei]SAH21787.1 Uncharacterised protein [Enterobacter hormaechei]
MDNNPRGFRAGKLSAQDHRRSESGDQAQLFHLLAQRFQGRAQHRFILVPVGMGGIHNGDLSGLARLPLLNIAHEITEPADVIHPQPPAMRCFTQSMLPEQGIQSVSANKNNRTRISKYGQIKTSPAIALSLAETAFSPDLPDGQRNNAQRHHAFKQRACRNEAPQKP